MFKFIFTGRLGKDAEVKTVGDKQVINFNVAYSQKLKDEEKTTWVSCGYWSDSKVHEYLKKGTQVLIEGIPDVRVHEDRGYLTCRVTSVELLGSKSDSEQPTKEKPVAKKEQKVEDYGDDLPF